MGSDKQQKLLALQAALTGNAQPLRDIKAKHGKRPYTEAELEERRAYLAELYGHQTTPQDVYAFFGRFIPTGGTAQCYRLTNGMDMYF